MSGGTAWRLTYRPGLDGLRGIAVLLVVGQHAGMPLMTRAGGVGVTLFFVLSGFLITTLLIEDRDLVSFWTRRARRLLPALAVFLAVMLAVGLSVTVIASAALYVANWDLAIEGPYAPLVHLWTLSVEEQFYLLWPLVFLLLMRLPRSTVLPIVLALACASAAARTLSTLNGDPYWWTFFTTHLRADALLLGCALALVFQRRPFTPGRWWIGIGVAAMIVVSVIPGRAFHTTLGIPMAELAAVALVAWASTRTSPFISWRPLVYLGVISYGLYLWHRPITWLGRDAGAEWWVMLALVLLSVAIAAASRRYVEEPFLRRRRRPADTSARPTSPIHLPESAG